MTTSAPVGHCYCVVVTLGRLDRIAGATGSLGSVDPARGIFLGGFVAVKFQIINDHFQKIIAYQY